MIEILSTADAARRIGRPDWQVRVIVDSLPNPVQRIGRQRAIPADRLDEIKEAIEARYRKQEAAAV